ncbi:MAG: DUF3626 domain-containing protein, partial [Bdellovibrionales bacterium]|nr:DUF3626 domain-containing protein [Bdellovibrionales bacterium]
MKLTPSQSKAIGYIEEFARTTLTVGQSELPNVLAMSNILPSELDAATELLRKHARVALHFHPDRPSQTGKLVVEAMLQEGVYKNQFETHVSNGRLDPVAEGERARWENRMFGDVFATQAAKLRERPKYGALDLMLHQDGPSPRFGSCYFLLSPEVSRRATFSYMDSHREPIE